MFEGDSARVPLNRRPSQSTSAGSFPRFKRGSRTRMVGDDLPSCRAGSLEDEAH